MKKSLILLLLISLLVLATLWSVHEKDTVSQKFDPVITTQDSNENPTKKNAVENIQSSQDMTVEEESDIVDTPEKLPSNLCKEQLAEQYPELDRQYHQVIERFYLTEEQMMGEGVYQNMPFESLKPLADSNDPQAMMVYGSEKIWFSALGVRLSGPDSRYRSSEQTKDIVNNHKVDLDGINEGESYLYNAAIFGKVGAIFEMTLLLDMAAKRLDAKSGEQEVVQELIAKSLAYEMLQADIHQSDPALKGMFLDSVAWRNSIQRLYADQEDYAEIKKQIESNADNIYQTLKERWEHDREYYGFDIYPDYLKGELEEYANAYLECHLR